MPSGLGSESTFISDIAFTILFGVTMISVSLLMTRGTLNVGTNLLEQSVTLTRAQSRSQSGWCYDNVMITK